MLSVWFLASLAAAPQVKVVAISQVAGLAADGAALMRASLAAAGVTVVEGGEDVPVVRIEIGRLADVVTVHVEARDAAGSTFAVANPTWPERQWKKLMKGDFDAFAQGVAEKLAPLAEASPPPAAEPVKIEPVKIDPPVPPEVPPVVVQKSRPAKLWVAIGTGAAFGVAAAVMFGISRADAARFNETTLVDGMRASSLTASELDALARRSNGLLLASGLSLAAAAICAVVALVWAL